MISINNKLELISSAVHFGFKFKGEQCALYVSNKESNQHSYIQYELDGVYQKRLRVEGKPTGPIVIKAVGEGNHVIWIYKAAEATTGNIIISKIVVYRQYYYPWRRIRYFGLCMCCRRIP